MEHQKRMVFKIYILYVCVYVHVIYISILKYIYKYIKNKKFFTMHHNSFH